MRVRICPASDTARLVAGIQCAMVLTAVDTTSVASPDSGLYPPPTAGTRAPAVPGAVGAALVVASATGAALLVLPVTRTYSTVSEVVVPGVTRSAIHNSRSPTKSTTCP